jgi:hypothetical protein
LEEMIDSLLIITSVMHDACIGACSTVAAVRALSLVCFHGRRRCAQVMKEQLRTRKNIPDDVMLGVRMRRGFLSFDGAMNGKDGGEVGCLFHERRRGCDKQATAGVCGAVARQCVDKCVGVLGRRRRWAPVHVAALSHLEHRSIYCCRCAALSVCNFPLQIISRDSRNTLLVVARQDMPRWGSNT